MTPSPASADLAGELACSWTARPEGRHRLIPDGCIDVLWLDTGELWVCGPESTAWDFELPPGRRAVGVRFRPGVAGRLLRVDGDRLRDRRVRLEDLLGSRVERVARERSGEADDTGGHDAEDAIVASARSWIDAAPPADALVSGLVAELTDPRPRSVGDVGDRLGLSTRQLRRRSDRTLGYGPAVFVRLIRFQRFLRALPRARTVAAAAATAGYADHSHLVRACRSIAGTTPTELLGWYEQTFPGVADPYKTDGHAAATLGR